MTPLQQWVVIAACMPVAMFLGWRWQRRHGNAGIVDVIWAAGLGASALLSAFTGQGAANARICLAVMAGVWSFRLAWHIWRRVRTEEDGRYRALREHWDGHQGKFFGLFMFQAGLAMLFCLPFLAVGASAARGTPVALALIIWGAAVTGETVADLQLDRFRNNPANRGKTCRDGLWRYSRHPNYFFEWCQWFAYVALAWGSPLAWVSWLGPVLMFVFLRWISGIPFTERQALRSRGEDYRDYQRHTPVFFPWFPRSRSAFHPDEAP